VWPHRITESATVREIVFRRTGLGIGQSQAALTGTMKSIECGDRARHRQERGTTLRPRADRHDAGLRDAWFIGYTADLVAGMARHGVMGR